MRIKTFRIKNHAWQEFICPGCGQVHKFDASSNKWNGDVNFPTLGKALLVMGPVRCYSMIKDGWITFFDDSHHENTSKRLLLPNI